MFRIRFQLIKIILLRKYAIEEEALGIEQWTENGSTITFKDDEKTLMLSIHLNGGVFKSKLAI